MKYFYIVSLIVAVLSNTCVVQAEITDVTISDENSGVLGFSGADTTIYSDWTPSSPAMYIYVNVMVDSALDSYNIFEDTTSQGAGFIRNSTHGDWTGYNFEIINQSGGPFTFSQNAPISYDVFGSDMTSPNLITVYNGGLISGSDFHATLRIKAESPGSFTIQEYFWFPEPSTFTMLGSAALGLLAYTWRRRKCAT
ncbi:MAG: PEP-CTERM sorting domain-containing protein [Thermoguttaceae bacterium]|jgi:hypothetical protein